MFASGSCGEGVKILSLQGLDMDPFLVGGCAPPWPQASSARKNRACGVLGHTPAKGMGIWLYCSPYHSPTQ